MQDRFQRTIEYVRISVTDRCNLRCRYCMPEQGVRKMCHEDILRFDEILRIVRALAALGVRKVRLTGGEPLVRKGILDLIREIRRVQGIEVISLTTNGVLLPEMAADLRAAGLDFVNVSLDSLDEETFSFLTRRPLIGRVEEGLRALEEAGFQDTKLNCVPLLGVNEDDVLKLAELAREKPMKVRYIELMPVGCAYEAGLRGMPMDEVRRRLQEAFGAFSPVRQEKRVRQEQQGQQEQQEQRVRRESSVRLEQREPPVRWEQQVRLVQSEPLAQREQSAQQEPLVQQEQPEPPVLPEQ